MEPQYSCSCLNNVVGRRLVYSYNHGNLRPDQSRNNLLAPHPTADLARSSYPLPFLVLSKFIRKVGFIDRELPQVGSRFTLLYVAILHMLASVAGLRSWQGFNYRFPFACLKRLHHQDKTDLTGCLLQVEYECHGSRSARAAA